MKRTFAGFAVALMACAAVPAATINTTLTVTNATVTLGAGTTGTSISISGPATLLTVGNGTFTSTSVTLDATGVSGSFTIALSGSADTITGTFKLPAAAVTGTTFTGGSIAVTGGALANAGVTGGSFPAISGAGSLGLNGINLSFNGSGTIVTGGTPPPAVPTITAVQDAASNTPTIAQGSIFIVKGTTLSAGGFTQFAPPRPQASGGVKVTFTPAAGGTGTDVYLVYLFNQGGVNQIAGILPSTVAPGSYNVTVTNGGVSAPFAAQVVPNKIGLFTQDSSGSGLASLQNFISPGVVDLNRLTTGSVNGVTISPAKPGQAVIAYGTGLGAYAAGDNTASPAFDFRSSLTIAAVVGGVSIPVDYAGRAGFAGEDQINFTLPANIPTGCAVPLQISVNGKLSAPASISIAPDASSTACVIPGFTPDQLKKFDNGGTYTAGGFSITQFSITLPSGTQKVNSIAGGFTQLTGFQLASAAQVNVSVIQSGSCQVILSTSGGTSAATAGGGATYLDAGTISINGPAGSNLTNLPLTKTLNTYSLSNIEGFNVPGQTSFTLPAGTYTLTGAGGPDVGTFNTFINLGSPLAVTGGLPASVTRSAGLTLNWTGGNATDLVEIIGSSSSTTGTGTSAITSSSTFICLTTAGQKTFTVPASILNQLPATATNSTSLLEVGSGTTPSLFGATLPKAGGSIDAGAFGSFLGIGATVTYQ